MKWEKVLAVFLGLTVGAGALFGCASKEAALTSALVMPKNDGAPVKLTIAGVRLEEKGIQAALEEIAEKYRADFPDTEIEITSLESPEEAEAVLKEGRADIVQVESENQLDWVKQSLLKDLYPEVLETWDERDTLTAAARQAVYSTGEERTYVIPFDFQQNMLYFRSDWFDAYNRDREEGLARCRSWDEIAGGTVAGQEVIGAVEKLGEKGRLVLGGREQLSACFNAILWSSVASLRIAHPSAAYFSAVQGHPTIFSLDYAAQGAEQFSRVCKNALLPECLDWTEDQAVEAFAQGKAAMLLADGSAEKTLRETMEPGTWDVTAFPRGLMGSALFEDRFTGWGISSKTASFETACHFLLYLSNGDNNTHFAKVCGTLPIHLDALDMEESLLSGERAVEMDMIKRSDWYQYNTPPVLYQAYEGWREQEQDALLRFLNGELSSQALLKQFEEYWYKALSDEGSLWKDPDFLRNH